jgi:hypothetical protein
MYLLYLDASGTPDIGDSAQPTFVLLGLTIHEGNWFALEKRVAGLKLRYQFPGVPLELHAKDICSSIKEQDESPSFESMTWEARRAEVMSSPGEETGGKSVERSTNSQRTLSRDGSNRTPHEIVMTNSVQSILDGEGVELPARWLT